MTAVCLLKLTVMTVITLVAGLITPIKPDKYITHFLNK